MKSSPFILSLFGLVALMSAANAQLSIPVGGYTETFTSAPVAAPPTSSWANLSVPGSSTAGNVENSTTLAEVTARMNNDWDKGGTGTGPMLASMITTSFLTTGVNGTPYANARVDGTVMITQPTTNAGIVVLASLRNSTGLAASQLLISFSVLNTNASLESPELGGLIVYGTTSGGVGGSWTYLAPDHAFVTGAINPAQTFNYSYNLGSLAPDAIMHVAFYDDNGLNPDGGYQTDNVRFEFVAIPEASTAMLSLLSLCGLTLARRRR